MANNRMYFRCEGCGAVLPVGKHFGMEWSVNADALEPWLEEHRWCHVPEVDGTHFCLAYEHDPSGKAEIPGP